MKQRNAFFLTIALAVSLLAGAYFLAVPRRAYRAAVEMREEGREVEGEETENPEEMARWDWMRLHDPRTGKIPDGIRRAELAYARTLPARGQALAKPGAVSSGPEWERRGPANVGGRTRALAIDAADPSTLLAGGVSGGMWRSTDGGASWTRTTSPEQLPAVSCLAQDTRPGHTGTWYYGTGEFYGNSASIDQAKYTGDGIFKSTDGGRSWQLLASTLSGSPVRLDNSFEYVWNVAVDPSNIGQDEVYAAVYGGIKRSTDGGATWDDVLGGFGLGGGYTDVVVTSTGVVYATMSSNGNPSGIWRSPDGINWVQITPANWPGTFSRIVIGPAPSNEDVVYFLGETPNGGFRVMSGSGSEWHSFWKYTFVAGDGSGDGGTWENRSSNLPPATTTSGGYRSQHSYDMVIKVKPDNENQVFIGGTNLFRSTNGFATGSQTTWIGGYKSSYVWLDFSYPNHHPDQHAIAFAPNDPSVIYSGNDGGIFRAPDALADSLAWTPLNNGYQTTQLYALAIDHATPGDNTIIAGMQDNSSWMTRSGNPADPWIQVGPGDGAYCAVADSGTAYYVSSQGGRVYRIGLNDSGDLNGFTRIDPTSGPAALFVNPFALDPAATSTIYHVSGTSLWRNTNVAAFPLDSSNTSKIPNWSRVNSNSTGLAFITSIGVSTANPAHRVYVGTANGDIGVFDDADKFINQPRIVQWPEFPSGYLACLSVDPLDGDKVMAVFSNYGVVSLFFTTDGGTSWTPIAGNLEEHPDGTGDGPSCRWASVLHRGPNTIYYVGTSTGLYSTTKLDGMNTVWVLEGASVMGNVVVSMIDVRQSDGLVAVGTHGNGVFTLRLGSAGVADEPTAAGRVALEANAPNPVRDVTTIGFTLGVAGPVRLALYDIAGREVRRLVDGATLEAGPHAVRLDVRDGALPAGLYYYSIEAAGERATRRMVVVP